jgi:hypothetical protein
MKMGTGVLGIEEQRMHSCKRKGEVIACITVQWWAGMYARPDKIVR